MSKEYIFEIGEGILNEETGEVCIKPTVKGELVRCKDCKHYDSEQCYCSAWGDMFGYWEECYPVAPDGFCNRGEVRNV